MMFAELTDRNSTQPVHVNPSHVIAVHKYGEGTSVWTTGINANGHSRVLDVAESVEDAVAIIQNASKR